MQTPDEIIQNIRLLNVATVLKRLTRLHRIALRCPNSPSAEAYRTIIKFYARS